MSSRRAIGSFSSCITRSIYCRGASPDLVTADLNSAVTLFSEPFFRPPVLYPRAICRLSNCVYFRLTCLKPFAGSGLPLGLPDWPGLKESMSWQGSPRRKSAKGRAPPRVLKPWFDLLSRLIGDFDCATPKLHTIGVKAAENGLSDILRMRCMFELSSGRDRSSCSAWSLPAQVFGKAAPSVVNDWLICLVHVGNLHSRTDYGVADSSAERRFRRFCRSVRALHVSGAQSGARCSRRVGKVLELVGGRYWTRTSDPCDVNTVLYQLS
jgi:hypothetical protein